MEYLFERTDYEIEQYMEDALSKSQEFSEDENLTPEVEEKWFETRKQKIYDTFKEEYDEYEEISEYFFGCSFSTYKFTYRRRKEEFLSSFEDYDVYDFLMNEFEQGLFTFNRKYMDPEMTKKIEASLRQRFMFLKEKANEEGYEVKVIENEKVVLTKVETTTPNTNETEIKDELDDPDLTGASIPVRLLYLYELGVIDFLKAKHPFVSSCNSLSRALSPILNSQANTINRPLRLIYNSELDNDRHPLNNEENYEKVKHELNEIGFRK